MSTIWTTEQVIGLAPDAASAKAGRGLATAARWSSLGFSDHAVWGECKGSGAKPYQVRIDLGEPAFKCSCPSRKFPCKHGLGLFLLYAEQRQALKQGDPPPWVADWLASRTERQEKKAAKDAAPAKPPDPEAKAKREANRAEKVADGLTRAERWLTDVMAEGLAAARAKPRSFWEQEAAAMVDAQCPGLARFIREAEAAAASGEGWEVRLAERLGRLWLLVQAGRRVDALPEALRAEVRSLLGYTLGKDDVLASGETILDEWFVVGQARESDGRLLTQRTWLWARKADRPALVLDFAAGGQPLERSFIVGGCFEGEVAFYPGAWPVRGLVKSRGDLTMRAPGEGMGDADLAAALGRVGAWLARTPWVERAPLLLRSVAFHGSKGAWRVRDAHGRSLDVAAADAGAAWSILALTGGHASTIFGEWDGRALTPLCVWTDGRGCNLAAQEQAA